MTDLKDGNKLQTLDITDLELPGGNENIFLRRAPVTETQKEAREWLTVEPKDYILDDYRFKITKKENGDVSIRIKGYSSDGSKVGIGLDVKKNTPYPIIAHDMKTCFLALFRHDIIKTLKPDADKQS